MPTSPPLPRITAEQPDLLGLGSVPVAWQLDAPGLLVTCDTNRVSNPDQLSLTAVQQVLRAAARQVRQPALLDDPPIWEVDPSPKPRSRAPRRRNKRSGLSPGQMSLF